MKHLGLLTSKIQSLIQLVYASYSGLVLRFDKNKEMLYVCNQILIHDRPKEEICQSILCCYELKVRIVSYNALIKVLHKKQNNNYHEKKYCIQIHD